MADLPSSGEEQTVRAAVRRHLGSEVRAVEKLTGRAGRRVFIVRLPDREVVLKVLNARKSRAVGCDFAVDALRRAGAPTPRVLAVDRSGRYEGEFFDYPFLILEKAEGMPMDQWLLERKPNLADRRAVLRRLGEILRRVHTVRVAKGWGNLDDDGIGRFNSWSEYLEGQRVRQADGRMVRTLNTAWLEREALISPEERAGLDALVQPRSGSDGPADARLVHNDLTLKNVFLDPEDLRITAVLDLHNALAGDPALDLARFEYFYRGRGHLAGLEAGYGELTEDFQRRRGPLLVFVLLEKIAWLRGRETRFPGRLEKDVALLRRKVETLARAGAGRPAGGG
jgi:aminoglycoside phosphotransferase (APT) family kinase protein